MDIMIWPALISAGLTADKRADKKGGPTCRCVTA